MFERLVIEMCSKRKSNLRLNGNQRKALHFFFGQVNHFYLPNRVMYGQQKRLIVGQQAPTPAIALHYNHLN
ncbi:hypothetical protein A4A49_15673 [Nicotiana attenuata]|uniref:Uncharacterized protein n=1 Tax=Nicotiana attenuata TaxID=49451 RepID=A0A1J6J438_NICAT|nr:hypothetical protein A4A49_15673 [Nicotiana attenuata]